MYIICLSDIGLDDTSLGRLISRMPEKSILLMEDIDVAMHQGLSREQPELESTKSHRKSSSESTNTNNITLSGLLNALDGVAAQEGRILFATTNKYSALDPALSRPGRMDIHIEFKNASRGQAVELFKRFFGHTSGSYGHETSLVKTAPGNGRMTTLEDTHNPGTHMIGSTGTLVSSKDARIVGLAHTERAPVLSEKDLQDLAESFAEAIPERAHSMASLQGYLMLYKCRPFDAVRETAAWIEKEKAAKKNQTNPIVGADPATLANVGSSTSYLASVSRFFLGDMPALLPQ
jgi:mitochondrial chaperone BCS1